MAGDQARWVACLAAAAATDHRRMVDSVFLSEVPSAIDADGLVTTASDIATSAEPLLVVSSTVLPRDQLIVWLIAPLVSVNRTPASVFRSPNSMENHP